MAGIGSILAGLGAGVAAAGGARPLGRATVLTALIAVPALAMIGQFVGEEALNPGDDAWDGRIVPIRLGLAVVAPGSLTLAICALRRGRWFPTLGLTTACVAVSYVLPFVVIVALTLVGGGSG